MKSIFTTIGVLILCPLLVIVLTGVYFVAALYLFGKPGLSANAMGEVAGRLAFTLGVPAGGIVGLAFLARYEKVDAQGWVNTVGGIASLVLIAALVLVPLYFGFGQAWDLLNGSGLGNIVAVGYIVVIYGVVHAVDPNFW